MKKSKVIKNQDMMAYASDNIRVFLEAVHLFCETEESSVYVIKGWGVDQRTGMAGEVVFNFDGEVINKIERYNKRPDICHSFPDIQIQGNPEFHVFLRIKKEDEKKNLRIIYKVGEAEELVAEYDGLKPQSSYLCKVEDDVKLENNQISVEGWMIHNPEASAEENTNYNYPVAVLDSTGKEIPFSREDKTREDVAIQNRLSEIEYPYGFILKWEMDPSETYTIHMGTSYDYVEKKVDVCKILFCEREKNRRFHNLLHMLKTRDQQTKKDDAWFLKKNGIVEYHKLIKKRFDLIDPEYQKYYESHRASNDELRRQRAEKINGPMISIVVPTYNTRPDFLRDMIESVLEQTYDNWQLCIADGSEGNKELEATLESYHQKDFRIVYTVCKKNLGISGNTNAALKLATGDYIALLDHDDILAPEALYEAATLIKENGNADIVYTDEDKFADDLKDHYQPAFKPDYNPDLLRSCNYITHLFVVKKEVACRAGEFNPKCDGSQDYDFILRCTEHAEHIYHIPKVLYHWRCHPESTALNQASKGYAYNAALVAIKSHLDRIGVDYVDVEAISNVLGVHRVNYRHSDKLISVVLIGNGTSTETSLIEKNTYKNIEIINIEYTEPLPRACNDAVKSAKGEYILFMDADMEVRLPDSIEKLLAYCEQNQVAVVGGKVLYTDETVYQTGVVLGYHNTCGRLLAGRHSLETGKYANVVLQQNTSAVLNSCFMVEKKLFQEFGGFDEAYVGAYFDVDFCLRAREQGYLVSFEPDAQFITHRDKYPGCDIVYEKYAGFENDEKHFREKWEKEINKPDPYYNKNLSLERLSFDVQY